MDVHDIRKFACHGFHGVHEAIRGAKDQIEAFAGKATEDLFGISAFGYILDIGGMYIGDIFLDISQPLVVRLRPTAIVMRPDQNHGYIELSFLDCRDLKPSDHFRSLSDLRCGWSPTSRDDRCQYSEQGEYSPELFALHFLLLLLINRTKLRIKSI